ncbi:MAG: hypothetical protein JJU41_03045 [Bacteroidetes bacterium]|nr:hypothetical protein [Bacteroidota bacterium]MCH8524983.1 hypothetical protein [Balneolales bacterium]
MIYVTILGVTLIAAFFASWYLMHTARSKERMLLLEKGMAWCLKSEPI